MAGTVTDRRQKRQNRPAKPVYDEMMPRKMRVCIVANVPENL